MKYYFFCLCIYLFASTSIFAQENKEKAVAAVIQEMFDGMRAGDSSRVHAVISDEAKFNSSSNREGKAYLTEGSLPRFLKSIGSPHDQVYDERVSNLQIHVDGDLATVWMNYSFYLGETFSHCGINTMTLHKGEAGWKIIFLADTRRKKDCE